MLEVVARNRLPAGHAGSLQQLTPLLEERGTRHHHLDGADVAGRQRSLDLADQWQARAGVVQEMSPRDGIVQAFDHAAVAQRQPQATAVLAAVEGMRPRSRHRVRCILPGDHVTAGAGTVMATVRRREGRRHRKACPTGRKIGPRRPAGVGTTSNSVATTAPLQKLRGSVSRTR